MRIAYFDCFSGAAGDMIVGACLDAGADPEYLRGEFSKLDLDSVEIQINKVNKKGISCTSFQPVDTNEKAASHRHLSHIVEIIQRADLSSAVQQNAIQIFENLARAEAKVHGTDINKVHFHEVGAVDAIMDVVGACIALENLGIEKVYGSPLTVGGGTVRCDHGIMPVPAPATAELIKGIEIVPTTARFELLTPTGAAILTTLCLRFGPLPQMRIESIGYGAGQRDYPDLPNVLRLLVGEQAAESTAETLSDEVCILETTIDDMPSEQVGYVMEKALGQGALDVYAAPVYMKKNRPGISLTVICSVSQGAELEELLFRETTTFGIRRRVSPRSILARKHKTVATCYGTIRIKVGYLAGEEVSCSVEFEDCRKAAEEHQVPVRQVIAQAMAAYQSSK
jgi:hypothetical protein